MVAIPTSNQPKKEVDEQELEKKKEEFEKKVAEAIRVTKEEVSQAEVKSEETEKLKIKVLWLAGDRINKLIGELPEAKKREIIRRFIDETGQSESFYYLATQFVSMLNKEQYDKACKHGLTVRVVKAIVSIRDEKLRESILERVVNEGLSADDIRTLLDKKKNKRSAAAAKRNQASDRKMSPLRVFSKGNERLRMLSETLGSCSEAVNRLSEAKSEDEKKDAVKQLVDFRAGANALVEELASFLKFTKTFDKAPKKA